MDEEAGGEVATEERLTPIAVVRVDGEMVVSALGVRQVSMTRAYLTWPWLVLRQHEQR